MELEVRSTDRGFTLIEFIDRYDVKCSLQKSSLATEEAIWLGCNDPNPKFLAPGKGWIDLELPEEWIFTTRMHLTQEQVRKLLPFLERFAETGELLE